MITVIRKYPNHKNKNHQRPTMIKEDIIMKWIIKHLEGIEEVFECEVNARVTMSLYANARLFVEFQNGSITTRYEVK